MANDSFKSKIYTKYIKRLLINYKNRNVDLFNILKKIGKDDIEITTGYDEFNDYNVHTLIFLLPGECFEKNISISSQMFICQEIKEDLNRIILESDEYIGEIKFDLKNLDKKASNKETESFLIEASESKDDIHVKDYLKTKIKNFEIPDFWDKDCLRVFISHSVTNYNIAKKLKDEFQKSSLSCFVAHKDIKPTTQWQKEIKKALKSMELFLSIVTENFNKSCWTNQEIGFALCKGIPIISIKIDTASPPGFIFEKQAITLNEKDIAPYSQNFLNLLNLIKEKFPKHPFIKKKFLSARDGCFSWAKDMFMDIINLDFNDKEIEEIVKTIEGPASTKINQLTILLSDPISSEHLEQLPKGEKNKYEYYRELLQDKILSQHTQKRYSIKNYKIIDNQAIPFKTQKANKKQEFEDIPF